MNQSYPASDVRNITGVSQRALEYWDERKVVQPSVKRAKGKGTERRYSYENLVELLVVRTLRESGLSLQKIRKGLDELRTRGSKHPLNEVLITDGKKFFWKRGEKVMSLLSGGQYMLSVVAVGHLCKEVKKATLALPKQRPQKTVQPAPARGKRSANGV